MNWTGSRVWLTGASSGIGAALAHELAGRGARLAVSARRVERLEALAGATGAVVVPCDVADLTAVRDAEEAARTALGAIDVAILNAGTFEQTSVEPFDPTAFREHVEVNLLGLVNCVAAVLPDMQRRRSGRIVGMASVAGYRGFPQSEAYGATKAAAINLLEALRIDLAASGITVQTISPGFVRSELTAKNAFPMPFLIDAEHAARSIADGVGRGKAEIVFPLPMMLAMKVLRLVPTRAYTDLYAAALRRAERRGAAGRESDDQPV